MPEEKKGTIEPDFGLRRRGPMMGEKPAIKDFGGTLRRILGYILDHRRSLILAFLCAVVSTVITIVGTRLNGYVVDTLIAEQNVYLLGVVCLGMACMYLVGVGAVYLQNTIMIRVAQRTSAKLRSDLFNRVQWLPLGYFDTHASGDVMSRLTSDVDNINNAMAQTVVQLFTSVVSIVGMLIAMLLLSPLLTLITLIVTPITFFTSRGIARRAQRFFVSQQRDLGRLGGYIEEMVSGQKVLRQFNREARTVAEFDELNDQYVGNAVRAQSASNVIGPFNNLINNFSYLLVSVVGGLCIINGVGAITVGAVFSFLLYMRNFTNPINNILNLINTLQLALASAERVFETMDEQPEEDREGAEDPGELRGDIQLRKAEFSYVPGKPVLRNADISARPGQTVAIVGPTGAGKTTIISLLTRFYDLDSGEILIDGRPVEAITRRSLRKSVSLVLQDTFLFSDSIRENIRYGRVDATDGQVVEAAKRARAHEFILQLPRGYDTVLSDNGQNLSQGQRQLLGIARAILSQASVLILDEATSSVDTRTERIIQAALLELMRGRTSFVIAHRLSTIRSADNILVIDGGQVVEQGTHEELLRAGGFYAKLYHSQFRHTPGQGEAG